MVGTCGSASYEVNVYWQRAKGVRPKIQTGLGSCREIGYSVRERKR